VNGLAVMSLRHVSPGLTEEQVPVQPLDLSSTRNRYCVANGTAFQESVTESPATLHFAWKFPGGESGGRPTLMGMVLLTDPVGP
jgi:hypothetical protein